MKIQSWNHFRIKLMRVVDFPHYIHFTALHCVLQIHAPRALQRGALSVAVKVPESSFTSSLWWRSRLLRAATTVLARSYTCVRAYYRTHPKKWLSLARPF